LNHRSLRRAGCSENKAKALKALAESANSGEVQLRSLSSKSDSEIMELLLPLFGVGKWTVEMFLIFQLGRLDIWPVGDLGVRRGWEKLFRMPDEIEINALIKAGEKFAPYRSHLAWYCWRAHSIYS
jgi:DNA-3-methyladenine glycosylase II